MWRPFAILTTSFSNVGKQELRKANSFCEFALSGKKVAEKFVGSRRVLLTTILILLCLIFVLLDVSMLIDALASLTVSIIHSPFQMLSRPVFLSYVLMSSGSSGLGRSVFLT